MAASPIFLVSTQSFSPCLAKPAGSLAPVPQPQFYDVHLGRASSSERRESRVLGSLVRRPEFKRRLGLDSMPAKDSALTFTAFVAALLAWYDAQQDVERNQAAHYDLTQYRPKPKAF